MNRIELRIGTDGRVRGLWTDEIDWSAIGHVHVERASFVEFDEQRQAWVVLAVKSVTRYETGSAG